VLRDLPLLKARLLLVVGDSDKAIPPSDAQRLHALVPGSEVVLVHHAGHLAHEEKPAETAAVIVDFARRTGALPAA
jgi:magnesium chelatase accessory protein